jgi:putative nucleotidyltransferase with HDIG domain
MKQWWAIGQKIRDLVITLQLLELTRPEHPLLRRLQNDAPGTYHHSLMVAQLAEAGVLATRGNPLLARVGGYYHDIGKVIRPSFFIENQTSYENPHNALAPKMSALIIQAHTRDGVELGRAYKLPQQILDIIEQHHGTSVISYFYRTHLEQAKQSGDAVAQEGDFRYPGPQPKTPEAVIVMLADSCEAAVRTLERPVPSKIAVLIAKIVKDKLESGELDESDITFKELKAIREAFIQNMTRVFHGRVKYKS